MRVLPAMCVLALLAACGSGAPAGGDAPDSTAASAGARANSSTGDSQSSEVAAAVSGGRASGNEASPTDGNRLSALRADSSTSAFELVTQPRQFEFPRDHGPHPAFRHEWWYVTGHLDSATGEPFGFELTFFRFALKPPMATEGMPPDAGPTAPAASAVQTEPPVQSAASAWRSRQIYMAHFAVSDIERKQFHVAERFARDALGLAGASAEPFRVSLDDWSLGAERPDTWHLVASDKGYSLDLEITPGSSIMLNGNAGLSQKASAEGAASYYYSIPRMAARGRLTRDGKPFDVKGTVWLDREWGSGSLGNDQQGWDWFALQLDDGSALMFYALRNRNSQRDSHSAGTWLAPDGTTHPLANDDVQIDVTDEWTSPRGIRYPARWKLRVRSLDLDVDIQPRLADQELNTSTRYWEGACTVVGKRQSRDITGKAYVELVGYTARQQ